jgi:hypothetical protein
MRALILLLLFAGLAIVIHSVYEEKFQHVQKQVRVEYRFLPRTLYEEQMEQTNALGDHKKMFNRDAPWH